MDKITRNPRIYKWVLLIAFIFIVSSKANAQFYAVKVDALGLLTTTLNVEGSMVIHNKWTLHLPLKVNPWEFGNKVYQQVTVMPGVRYWLVESYSRGWFIGVNALASLYNYNGLLTDKIDYFGRDYRYDGHGFGGGISAGLSLPMGKRWNIEFEVGVNGMFGNHDIYYEKGMNTHATVREGFQKGFFVVPGKIGANIVYLF